MHLTLCIIKKGRSAGVLSRRTKVIVSACVSIAIMIVIFLFSNQDSGDSSSLSEKVSFLIASVFVDGFSNMSASEQLAWIETLSWPVRKTAHAIEYGCLAISLMITCWQVHCFRNERLSKTMSLTRQLGIDWLLAFALSVVYAITDEIHQMFIDGRAGQVSDVFVDASGALIGSALCVLIMYVYLRKRRLEQNNA